MTLQEALDYIEILEQENALLREELEKYKSLGRKVHDEKWMTSYTTWKELYESGLTIMEIVEKTNISRRTCYRYKAYFEQLQSAPKENKEGKNEL